MANKKPRRGKVEDTNEAAEIFSSRLTYTKAFVPQQETVAEEKPSEGEAMYHHYTDED
ncbi:hypothetical protein [Halobacillus halophilus]|uniref:hypothetical protein n=1 Tax=Halobacillus halophilus TaxID=1570 RepID=UPI001CD68998|nr:hypothetical protein [Halobacillus halophilus]MCA1012412.1 hypothetical protein [Halobacillus halophilus]